MIYTRTQKATFRNYKKIKKRKLMKHIKLSIYLKEWNYFFYRKTLHVTGHSAFNGIDDKVNRIGNEHWVIILSIIRKVEHICHFSDTQCKITFIQTNLDHRIFKSKKTWQCKIITCLTNKKCFEERPKLTGTFYISKQNNLDYTMK